MVALDAEVKSRALAATRALARVGSVRAAYVFGSHVNGRADEWSDIDVAAFVEGAESWDLWYRTRVIVQVQKEVGFSIDAHLFPAVLLQNAEPGSFASEILRHGLRIL